MLRWLIVNHRVAVALFNCVPLLLIPFSALEKRGGKCDNVTECACAFSNCDRVWGL